MMRSTLSVSAWPTPQDPVHPDPGRDASRQTPRLSRSSSRRASTEPECFSFAPQDGRDFVVGGVRVVKYRPVIINEASGSGENAFLL